MTSMSKKIVLSLVASLAISSNVMAQTDKVYALVNNETIKGSDIAVALRNPQLNFDTIPKDQQKSILSNLIEQKVLAQDAFKSNIVKTKEYKNELEKLKQNLAYQIWIRDFSKTIKVKTKVLEEFYNKNKSKFKTPLKLKASHILVKTKKEAQAIIDELKKAIDTKAIFTKLAKTKSIGPSGKTGGELGWFTKEKMVPEFSQAAMKLTKGNFTTEPVKTQFGYHIIYLDDKQNNSTLKFEEVKEKLQQEFLQKEFVEKIKAKAKQLIKQANIQYK